MADANRSRARRQVRPAEAWGEYGWSQPAARAARQRAQQSQMPPSNHQADARPAGYPRPERATFPQSPGGTRRTVTIRGRGDERLVPRHSRSRPPARPHYRGGFRPDRVAMWAVMLGVLLVLVAAASSHA